MAADIPVLGASFTILVMVAFLASPGIGVVVDWFARRRRSCWQRTVARRGRANCWSPQLRRCLRSFPVGSRAPATEGVRLEMGSASPIRRHRPTACGLLRAPERSLLRPRFSRPAYPRAHARCPASRLLSVPRILFWSYTCAHVAAAVRSHLVLEAQVHRR